MAKARGFRAGLLVSIREALAKVVQGSDLTAAESRGVILEIMGGEATPAQVAGFLVALAMKGETPAEVAGAARAMREMATRVTTRRRPLVDTCGTGGDHAGTFNISTGSALVVAGAGVAVAKHGNRAASSRSGSADVLEALGLNLGLDPAAVAESIERIGFGFLFAASLHGSMKHAAGPRGELGIRTVFNLLGPLTNPAGASFQVVGVARPELVGLLAEALLDLGTERALVVHGHGGVDEITPTGPAEVAEVVGGEVRRYRLDPADYGIPRGRAEELKGGTPEENAAILRAILAGERGSRRDAVVLNAAAALLAGGAAADFQEGIRLAEESLDSGRAQEKLAALLAFAPRRSP